RDDVAPAHIRRQHDRTGIRVGDLAQPVGIVDRARSNDHALRAVREERLDRLGRSHAAADLHGRRRVRKQVAHDRAIASAPRRRVEVHHVQALEAVADPAARDVTRVADANLLFLEVTADELDDAALAQVYGRDGEHDYEAWTE